MKFLSIVLGFLLASCSEKVDCERFRVGKFKLNNTEYGTETIIERSETIQFEKSLTNEWESKYRITWENDCEYYLEIISGPQELIEMYKGKLIYVRITSTDVDGYYFTATFEGFEYPSKDKALKIE